MSKSFGLKEVCINFILGILIVSSFYIGVESNWKLGFIIAFFSAVMNAINIVSVPRGIRVSLAGQTLSMLLVALVMTREIALFLSFRGGVCFIILSLIVWTISSQFILKNLGITERRS